MFTVYRAYKAFNYEIDGSFTVVTEPAKTIATALTACAAYLEDPNCVNVKIWRRGPNDEILFDYWQL